MRNFYYNNSALFTYGTDGKTLFDLNFDGYFFDTQIIRFYFYFDTVNIDKSYILSYFNDGGYSSSPTTKKRFKMMSDTIIKCISDNIKAEKDENKIACLEYAKQVVLAVSGLYLTKYYKTERKIFNELTVNGQHFKGYFSFN